MTPLLIDTHVLLWFVGEASKLGRRALRLAEHAAESERLLVSAITFWEVAQLVSNERLRLRYSVSVWRRQVMQLGIRELPLNGEIGIRAVEVMPDHADPADRMILATALETGASLMTADRRLLDWRGTLSRHDARQ